MEIQKRHGLDMGNLLLTSLMRKRKKSVAKQRVAKGINGEMIEEGIDLILPLAKGCGLHPETNDSNLYL